MRKNSENQLRWPIKLKGKQYIRDEPTQNVYIKKKKTLLDISKYARRWLLS